MFVVAVDALKVARLHGVAWPLVEFCGFFWRVSWSIFLRFFVFNETLVFEFCCSSIKYRLQIQNLF